MSCERFIPRYNQSLTDPDSPVHDSLKSAMVIYEHIGTRKDPVSKGPVYLSTAVEKEPCLIYNFNDVGWTGAVIFIFIVVIMIKLVIASTNDEFLNGVYYNLGSFQHLYMGIDNIRWRSHLV